jgi:hypothetical protein
LKLKTVTMTSILELLSYDNTVFSAYAFWSAILILKMAAMAPLTARQRIKNQVFQFSSF